MEIFLTDIDKLLDDFENEDLESTQIETYDSSGYNSLKVNIDLERQTQTPSNGDLNILEYFTPTKTKSPLNSFFSNTLTVDSKSNEIYYHCEETTGKVTEEILDEKTNIRNMHDSPDISYNNDKIDTSLKNDIETKRNQAIGEPSIIFENSSTSECWSPEMQPKKIPRPNSLLLLTSLINDEKAAVNINNSQTVLNKDKLTNYDVIQKDTQSLKSLNLYQNVIIKDNIIENSNIIDIQTEHDITEYTNDKNSRDSQDKVSESFSTTNKSEQLSEIWQGIPLEELGVKEPKWISDTTSDTCMECEMYFTIFRRRHHCRACGRLLCNKCCSLKIELCFTSKLLQKKRVCVTCFQYLIRKSPSIITPTQIQSYSNLRDIEVNSKDQTSREPSMIDTYEFTFSKTIELTKLSCLDQYSNVQIITITKNLHLHLQIIRFPYCTCNIKDESVSGNDQQECNCDSIECWYFASMGLETIGVEEIIVLLKKLPDENAPPIEILQYYFQVYQRAFKNETKCDNIEMTIQSFGENNKNLKDWAGILHIRPSFQNLDKIPSVRSSFLIGILIHHLEFPWAMLLPLRLILALGKQSVFYPCSIISDRNRSPVYVDIGNTILQIIKPVFPSSYTSEQSSVVQMQVPNVPGMWIHLLPSHESIVQIPKSSYVHLLEILSARLSDNSPLALAASFSREADSHLVCCQDHKTGEYFSEAISIQNTERMITGSTMILLVPCKNNDEHGTFIVEDVIVVKFSDIQLGCVLDSLKSMTDIALQYGSSSPGISKSIIKIIWTESRQMCDMVSVERFSLVTDETIQKALNFITSDENKIIKSQRVPSSLQNITTNNEEESCAFLTLVWTRYHMVITVNELEKSSIQKHVDFEELVRDIAYHFAKSINIFLNMLRKMKLVNIGLRTNITSDTVDCLIGCSRNYQYNFISEKNIADFPISSSFTAQSNDSECLKCGCVESLPDECLKYLNETFIPFLYSKTKLLRNESLVSELEFHIID